MKFILFFIFTINIFSDKTIHLKSHKEKTEELFENDFEKHNKNKPMFQFNFSNPFAKKDSNIDKQLKELYDRIEKLEKELESKKNKSKKVQLKETKEDWEIELEKDLKKLKINPSSNQTTNSNQNIDLEDWEAQLEKDLKSQKAQSKKFANSRNTNSPTMLNSSGERNNQNLMMDINVAVDMVGQWDKNKTKTTKNSFDLREAEFGFNAAVDQWLRGSLLIAAHNENGKFFFEVHEAKVQFPFIHKYVSLTAGRMFLDLGRLNKIHRHDRPFTTTPLVHERMLDIESAQDTGMELNLLAPWKWITQELVLGATNGRTWGHTHSDGVNKNNPHFYFHQKNFYYFGNNVGAQFGFTGSRFEPDAINTKIVRNQYGFDFVLKWNRSFLKAFTLMSEFWLRETAYPYSLSTNKTPDSEHYFGYYVFGDYLFHQQWSLGFRYDFFTNKNLKDKNGYVVDNYLNSYTPQLTFKPSEFSFIRASFERRFTLDMTIETNRIDIRPAEIQFNEYVQNIGKEVSKQITETYQFYLQCTFILGTHPPHQY